MTSIDQQVFEGFYASVGNDKDFLIEIVEEFFTDAPSLLGQIEESIASGDAGALRQAAHSLKTTSAYLGAMHLSSLCKQLENQGKQQSFDGVPHLYEEAGVEYENVRAELIDLCS